ncbi:MAG TPA: tryptophan 7-halogenase, partial [Jatrophihabitans sp.]|nr:tryptophan 7-halogenase [Jatrophihabitans sp.]
DVNFKEYLRNVANWQYFTGYAPWSNPNDILIEAVPSVGGWLWAIPITDEKVSIGWVIAADEFAAMREQDRSVDELFAAAIEASKEVCKVVAPARPEPGIRTARDFSHAAKDLAGPGWLAVGDAAAFIDPLFSSGVWLSTSGAWLAARALDAALRQPAAETTAFERYQQVYLQIVEDMFAYVLYFSDPHRNKEDYLEKAAAATKVFSENSQVGFISLISGITALPQILDFNPLGETGMRQTFSEAVRA